MGGSLISLLLRYKSQLWWPYQYYDPPLRCFTFKDFQLALTIEEYEKLLGWYVKERPPFTKLGEPLMPETVAEALHLPIEEVSLGLGPMGFARKFLEDKAWAFLHALDRDHAKLKKKSEEDLELLSESRKKAKLEEDLKEKYQEGLTQADMGLSSLRKQLKQTEKE
ncbi:hypothetical protein KIW84_034840 [Lathyrus oleraceus]|uniref:DUF7745 domain-containing protein n=1 Tax=Pisum sativum TaxID=3888 RepID=A0A9D4XZG6_PEA|nr:hypothetical protein KIW84_034840 [Pisum sativum]